MRVVDLQYAHQLFLFDMDFKMFTWVQMFFVFFIDIVNHIFTSLVHFKLFCDATPEFLKLQIFNLFSQLIWGHKISVYKYRIIGILCLK